MLADPGADVTLVPAAVIERLGIERTPERRYELVDFDGSTSLAPVARMESVFLGTERSPNPQREPFAGARGRGQQREPSI